MNKPLLIFIILGSLIIFGAVVYTKYGKTKSDVSKFEKYDDSDFGPQEGIDW